MLMRMLSKDDKEKLLELAALFILADKPLLWEGLTSDEINSDTDLSELSIKLSEQDKELMKELQHRAEEEWDGCEFEYSDPLSSITEELSDVIKSYPLIKMESPEVRLQAASKVLEKLLEKKYEFPHTPKVILFEIFMVVLRDGSMSTIELNLIKEFQLYHGMEDFIFDEILERSETLNQEINKTISIILE